MPDILGSKKRARVSSRLLTQLRGKAWALYGLISVITADAALLHAKSHKNEEGPFPRLKSLLLTHWTSIYRHLEPNWKTQLNSPPFISPPFAFWL